MLSNTGIVVAPNCAERVGAKSAIMHYRARTRLRSELCRPIDHQLELDIVAVRWHQYVMPSAAKFASSIRPVAGICFTSW